MVLSSDSYIARKRKKEVKMKFLKLIKEKPSNSVNESSQGIKDKQPISLLKPTNKESPLSDLIKDSHNNIITETILTNGIKKSLEKGPIFPLYKIHSCYSSSFNTESNPYHGFFLSFKDGFSSNQRNNLSRKSLDNGIDFINKNDFEREFNDLIGIFPDHQKKELTSIYKKVGLGVLSKLKQIYLERDHFDRKIEKSEFLLESQELNKCISDISLSYDKTDKEPSYKKDLSMFIQNKNQEEAMSSNQQIISEIMMIRRRLQNLEYKLQDNNYEEESTISFNITK